MLRSERGNSSLIFSCGIAVLAVAVVLGVKLLLNPFLGSIAPFLLFFAAIMGSAVYGGMPAGCIATLLAALVSHYCLLYPLDSVIWIPLHKILPTGLFLIEGILLSWLVSTLIQTQSRMQRERQALQESEDRYRVLVESVQDYAIYLIDPQGYITSWNLGAQKLKGYQAHEIIGRHFSCFYSEQDIEQGTPEQLLAIATTQNHAEDEGWRIRKDGSRFWANVILIAMLDAQGNLKGFSKMTRDLSDRKRSEEALQNAYVDLEKKVQERTAELATANAQLQQQILERQRAEKALQESEWRFRAIFNQTFQFIGLMQPDGLLLEANQTALDFGGLNREEVIDHWFWEARWWTLSQATQEQLKQAIAQAATGTFVRYEVDVLGAENTVITIDFSIKPVRDEFGNVVLLIPEGRDITERKQAEQTLRSFFESASMMMGIVELIDNDTDILHITDNPATGRFFSYSPEKNNPQRATEKGASREQIQQWIRYYREAEQTQAPVRFEYLHKTPSVGFWLSATVCAIPVTPGNRPRFAYIVEDISDRKQVEAQIRQLNAELEQRVQERTAQLEIANRQLASEITERERALQDLQQVQESLRQSEQNFRLVAESMPQIVWTALPDGAVDYYNRRWLEYSGIPQAGGEGWGWRPVLYPEDEQITIQAWQHAVQTGSLYECEHRVRRYDGEFHWFLSRGLPLRNEKGEIVKWFGTATEIHEQKRIQEELRTRARQQAAIAALGQRALSQINLTTLMDEVTQLIAQTLEVEYSKVLELLPNGESLLLRSGFGWAAGLIGQAQVSADLDSQAGYTLISAEPVVVTNWMTETRFQGPPLLHQHGVISGISTVIAGQTRPFGVLGVHSTRQRQFSQDDIHFLQAAANILAEAIQRGQAREILQHQSAELALANRLKDEFLATLSHELRTPLNAMLGWSRLLPTTRLTPEMTARALETISRNTQSLAQLVEDVLDMSDIITGKLRLKVEVVQLTAVIQAAIAALQLATEAKHLQIETQFERNVPPVLGDEGRLQQVVWNLLSNAVKFTPSGGSVKIRLSLENHQELPIASPYVQIQVSDTGRGITAEFLPYVFDRFRQADGSTTRAYGGLGLGLAIVRHLVELHGGMVIAESPGLEMGATFTVQLPLFPDR